MQPIEINIVVRLDVTNYTLVCFEKNKEMVKNDSLKFSLLQSLKEQEKIHFVHWNAGILWRLVYGTIGLWNQYWKIGLWDHLKQITVNCWLEKKSTNNVTY